MSFVIGEITLPTIPGSAHFRFRRKILAPEVMVRLPTLLNMGPTVPVLKIKGYLAVQGQDADYLETNYLIPLRDRVWRKAAFSRVIGEDDMYNGGAGKWSAIGWGSGALGAPTVSDNTLVKIKGANSLKAIIGGGSYLYSGAQRTWAEDQNWSNNDFISQWLYGLNSGAFAIELYDGSLTETETITDNFSGWQRKLQLLSAFTTVNLEKIRRIRIGRSTVGTTYFDRIIVGAGAYVNGPGSRYDGIYLIRDVIWKEEHKTVGIFPYEIELWLQDDFF